MQTSFAQSESTPDTKLCQTDCLNTTPMPSIDEISDIENSFFGKSYLQSIIQSRSNILNKTPLVSYDETTIGSRSRRSPLPKLVFYDETNTSDAIEETGHKSYKTPDKMPNLVPYNLTAINNSSSESSENETNLTQHKLVPYTDTIINESMEGCPPHPLKVVPYDETCLLYTSPSPRDS